MFTMFTDLFRRKDFSRADFSCIETYEMYPRLASPKIEYVEL